MSHSHSYEHDHPHSHSHDHDHPAADHGHTHEILDGPGSYMGREMPIIEGRIWSERAFTVGIGGYVPSSSKSRTFMGRRMVTCAPEERNVRPPQHYVRF